MPPNDVNQAIDYAICLEIIAKQVFQLRSPDYCREYPNWPGQVGLEVEMLPLKADAFAKDSGEVTTLFGPNGLTRTLLDVAKRYGWECKYAPNSEPTPDHLMSIDLKNRGNISFEPGGQVEFSSLPYPCLSEALKVLTHAQNVLTREFNAIGATLTQMGINPWQTADQMGLQMQKPRYRAQDEYFAQISPYGKRMMRQTCTIQVNLDFGGDEQTLAKRYVLAVLLAPFATAIFANSPYVDGKLSGFQSSRAEAWRHIDPTRTGVLPVGEIIGNWKKDLCVQSYGEAVLDANVVWVEALNFEVPTQPFTFRQWLDKPYKGVRPTSTDFMTHLSLFYPEVRARGFLELRSVDCQSRVWQAVPALFYTSMLYVDEAMEKAIERLSPLAPKLSDLLIKGSKAGMADKEIAEHARWLMDLAYTAVKKLPPCFQGEHTFRALEVFANYFTFKGRSPASDIIDQIKTAHGKYLPSTFAQIESAWQRLIE